VKIKTLVTYGAIPYGKVIDASVSVTKTMAVYLDDTSSTIYYYSGQFEVVEESEGNKQLTSLRQLLGQDIKTLEFK
jgi:hypothetical protein